MGFESGVDPIDIWSAVHIASGLGIGFVGRFWRWAAMWRWAMVLIVGFEFLEAGLRMVPAPAEGGLFEYESVPNIIADVVLGLFGFAVVNLYVRRLATAVPTPADDA